MKMKRFAKVLCFALVVFAGVMMFGGCSNGASLENIGLSEPIKTNYKLNETLDLGTSKLVLTYSDDSQQTISITTSMISGFDSSTCGRKTMTISYKGKSEKIDYVVYTTDAATVKSAIRTKLIDTDKILLQVVKSMDDISATFTYVRNANIYKLVGVNGGTDEQYYDTVAHKEYKNNDDGEAEIVDFEGTDEQIIDNYFIFSIWEAGCTISNQEVKIANEEYVLTYSYDTNLGISHNVTITASMDFSIRTMKIVETLTEDESVDYECTYSFTYTYDDAVPAITFPSI